MKGLDLSRFALSLGAAGALLAGCGGSQPPIGAPGAMPQTGALAARGDSSNYKVLYSFGAGSDGANPLAGLVHVGGKLYGTTLNGGSYICYTRSSYGGCGTVFSITTRGAEKVLYFFRAPPDGNFPFASLLDAGGTLYGTTSGGGAYTTCLFAYAYDPGCGTVFSITPSGTEKILHSFGSGSDGSSPFASLLDVNGTLYGTTRSGGSGSACEGGCGTVFSITPSGIEKILHSFDGGNDGSYPLASLIRVKNMLYGTTPSGGDGYPCRRGGCGTVFSITLGGKERVLHSFSGPDGAQPEASLIAVNGTLYGTTYSGAGTVFSITPSGKEKVLHSFGSGTDGSAPYAGLIAVNGTLYGTTVFGGRDGFGTVFRITSSGTEKVLHNFGSGSDGRGPYAGLIAVKGMLYGTTDSGGTANKGTVFGLNP